MAPMPLSIACLQLAPCRSLDESLAAGLTACRAAKGQNADIALFPEMWSNGYSLPETEADVEIWREQAIDERSEYFQTFRRLAAELEMAIVLTYLEKTHNSPRNSLAVIDRRGHVVHRYAKVHTCDFGNERWLDRGTGFPVTELETHHGSVKLGTMICFDREFPEAARALMLAGAEIVLVPNACEIEQNRRNQLQTRAFENSVGIALANYSSGEGNGHSLAFDGIPYKFDQASGRSKSSDQVLLEAGAEAGIFMVNFDLEALRAFRRVEVWGNAYRRPEHYCSIVDSAIQEPFRREDRKSL